MVTRIRQVGSSWWLVAISVVCGAVGIGLGAGRASANAGAVGVFSAHHPLVARGYVQSAEFTAADGDVEDEFGTSVAVSGHTIVVGVPDHQVGGNFRQGAVYVFSQSGKGWPHLTQVAELHASDGATSDNFGTSVGIDGNTIVVGAPSHTDGSNSDQGAAYVFVKPARGWRNATQTAELTASDGSSFIAFGWSAAISGSTIVIGAPNQTVNGITYQGAAYVYSKPANGWTNSTQTAELASSNGVLFSGFAHALAIDGSTIAVGAYAQPNSAGSVQGAVYVFTKRASSWANSTQTAELTASDGVANQYLGISVAISGNTIVTGADSQTVGANSAQGAIYTFSRESHGWTSTTQTAKLTAADGAAGDSLGSAVAVSGLTVIGSAIGREVGANFEQGTGYVFTRPALASLDATLTGQEHTRHSITVRPGGVVHGTATLGGVDAAAATGTVSYAVYSDRRCRRRVAGGKQLPIATPGVLPSSTSIRLKRAGRYYWRVFYSGDASNNAATTTCGALVEIVKR